MISRLTGHLRAAIGECRHDYLTMTVDTHCKAINGSVKRFAFECRYCGIRIEVADLRDQEVGDV